MNKNKSLIIAHLIKFGLKSVNSINYMSWAYAELKKKKIEGWVIVKFSLNETGKVDSAEIYKEYPVGVFSDSAITSVRESIYKPTVRDGILQRTDNLRTKINFKMAPSKKAHKNMDCDLSKPEDSANNLCSQIE